MKGLRMITSKFSVTETADRVVHFIEEEGLHLFARIDHASQAAKNGLNLRPTEVLIFGNPKIGTLLMQNRQTTAIDLPVKALVMEDEAGKTVIAYNTVEWLKKRHDLTDEKTLSKIGQKIHKICSTAAGS